MAAAAVLVDGGDWPGLIRLQYIGCQLSVRTARCLTKGVAADQPSTSQEMDRSGKEDYRLQLVVCPRVILQVPGPEPGLHQSHGAEM